MLATLPETPIAATGEIRPGGLGTLLEHHPGLKLLSLDCFDTILWRRVDKPTDVFYDLQHHPAFAAAGLDARRRIRAEQLARKTGMARRASPEVTLADIYRTALPQLDDAAVAALEEAELQAEIDACYAHPDAVALLRDARLRGIPVMLVSDTYLTEAQLRRLLQATLPADAYAAIGRVLVSCEQGVSKWMGLFKQIRQRLNPPVRHMLHVGDNAKADFIAPQQAGIPALHLKQLAPGVARRRKFHAMSMQLLAPDVRERRPLYSLYHGLHAGLADDADAGRVIGHAGIGMVMHAFATWFLSRKRELEADGRPVKVAFLLRDGHLPWRACEALAGGTVGKPVYLSRFAALASTFRGIEDIDRYLAQFLASGKYASVLKQLGIDGALAERILAETQASPMPAREFAHQVHVPLVVARILERSKAYRARLKAYLDRELDLQPGDRLVMVDLGYVGTVPRVLSPMMRDEWGVDLHACYLMCTPEAREGVQAQALIDPAHVDPRAIDALLPFASMLENLCTTDGGSVEDYTDAGDPVLTEDRTEAAQAARVREIQDHAVDFVRTAGRHFAEALSPPTERMLRDAALSEFGRMVFFPDRDELAHYAGFTHELNLGTDTTFRMNDTEAGLAELRRHGIFYAMNKTDSRRLSTPHELRTMGAELSLAMLTTQRFGLAFNHEDWTLRSQALSVLLTRDDQVARHEVEGQHTYDGCYQLLVALGNGDWNVGLLLGERFEWVQVMDARVITNGKVGVDGTALDIYDCLVFDGITDVGHRLLHCQDGQALAMLPAGTLQGGQNLILQLVLRPIVEANR